MSPIGDPEKPTLCLSFRVKALSSAHVAAPPGRVRQRPVVRCVPRHRIPTQSSTLTDVPCNVPPIQPVPECRSQVQGKREEATVPHRARLHAVFLYGVVNIASTGDLAASRSCALSRV
ncbi:hypothetical protein MRX96_006581 [Rhipicephalus microplus]